MPRIIFSDQFTEHEKDILSATVQSNIEFLQIEDKDFLVRIARKSFPDKRMFGYLTLSDDDTDDYRDFEIYLSSHSDLHRSMKTLSHEMIHAQQHLSKKLVVANRGLYWKGTYVPEYIATDMNYYSYFPWENEAHHWDYKLYSAATQKLNIPQEPDDD